MGSEEGDEEKEEQEDFTRHMEEIPRAREILPCKRSGAVVGEKVESVEFQDVRRGRDGQGDGTSLLPCGAKSLNRETVDDLLTKFSLNKCLFIGYNGALL